MNNILWKIITRETWKIPSLWSLAEFLCSFRTLEHTMIYGIWNPTSAMAWRTSALQFHWNYWDRSQIHVNHERKETKHLYSFEQCCVMKFPQVFESCICSINDIYDSCILIMCVNKQNKSSLINSIYVFIIGLQSYSHSGFYSLFHQLWVKKQVCKWRKDRHLIVQTCRVSHLGSQHSPQMILSAHFVMNG